MRLDKLLCDQLPACSPGGQTGEAGRVRVDGRRARKGQEVLPGAVVDIEADCDEQLRLRANPELTMEVLHEDNAVVAVNKPAGMPTQALRPSETETVANFLLARYPEMADVGSPLEPGLVHRLDNDTSGILLAARTAAAHAALRRQFAGHLVVKKYLALVRGDLDQAATIDAPIEQASGKGRRMKTASPGSGRDAATHYLPLRRFGSHTLLEVEICSGVRHQIRVHLTAIGHPVDGDRLYDPDADATVGRHLLHASSIVFVHPESGDKVTVRSELPEDFRERLAEIESLRSAFDYALPAPLPLVVFEQALQKLLTLLGS
jgi:23S rRNA pseudouridine1911/1915/1917 synthase